MTDIKNYDFYTTEMGRAMMDKLFFLHHIDATYFVDYGCSDGQMLEAISDRVNGEYVGYDIDRNMIELAKRRSVPRTLFTNDWNNVKFDIAYVAEYGGHPKSCLILSSIIHEIYSYGDEDSINEFWNRVFNSGFDYIVIRDMAMKENYRYGNIGAEFCSKFFGKIYENKLIEYEKQLIEYEKQWGPVNENIQNFMHFLLKYRYKDNWNREVKENYFPLTVEDIQEIIFNKGSKYKKVLFDHFSVPFIRKQIKKDFGIEATWPTHYKLILELNL